MTQVAIPGLAFFLFGERGQIPVLGKVVAGDWVNIQFIDMGEVNALDGFGHGYDFLGESLDLCLIHLGKIRKPLAQLGIAGKIHAGRGIDLELIARPADI